MKAIFSILFSLYVLSTNATHVAGGLITYEATGIANEYDFTLTVYRDCDAFANLGTVQQIDLLNSCGIPVTSSLLLTNASVSEISQICSADLPNTACNMGTGALEGMEKQVFTGTYSLSSCSEWTLSWAACNRNASINLLDSDTECFYTETKINNQNYTCNSSPRVIGLYQIPYICSNQNINLSTFITDPDSDSLHFSFTSALDYNANAIQYVLPYSSTSPIPGITLSPSGDISVNYGISGNYVLTILVEEFDALGAFKGSILHDFQFVIENCTNQTPSYTSVTNFNNNGTSASLSGDTIYAGPNDEFCIDIQFTDADASQQLQTTTDILNVLPFATVTSTPGNPSTTTICWVYNINHMGSSFSVRATDDACPVSGIASKLFNLALPTSISNIPDTIPFCNNALPVLNFACNNTDILEWTDTNGVPLTVGTDISCNPCNTPDFLFSNDTLISVRLFNAPQVTKNINLEYINGNLNILPDSIILCAQDSLTIVGPYPNYNQVWTINNLSSTLNNITIDSSSQGMLHYNLNVQNTCYIQDSAVITVNHVIATAINNGSDLEANQHASYQWLFNNSPVAGAINQLHFPQNNGDYSFIGYDQWNCSDTSNIITITTAGLAEEDISTSIVRFKNRIELKKLAETGAIQIFDIQGKIVLEQAISDSDMTLTLPSSNQTFIIRVIDDYGSVVLVKKL